jgi:hypothetical protein
MLSRCWRVLVNAVRMGDLETMVNENPGLVNAATDLERRLRPSDTSAMRLIAPGGCGGAHRGVRLLIERAAT